MNRSFLAPFAMLYGLVIRVRHKLFDWGIFRSQEYDVPIVCVGNLTVGGTGKTPVAEMLIAHLRQTYRVALLSRGYRRRTKGYVEAEVNASFLTVGDEPKQIKMKFPDVVVAVCEKRREGIRRILEEHPDVNLIILDDGFQHRYVEPWVNILLMDYTRPVYRDHLLPWGMLRDTVSQLYRAHFVLVTKCPPGLSPLDRRIIRKSLGLYPYQCLFFTSTESGNAQPLFPDETSRTLRAGASVVVMSGIGNPGAFLEEMGRRYRVEGVLEFPDHHPYRSRDLKTMADALADAPEGTVIVTTEKDAVKLTNRKKIPKQIRERLYYVPIRIVFNDNSEKDFLNNLDYDVRTNPKYSLLHP